MSQTTPPDFHDADLLDRLISADAATLDVLDFGVIGFGLDAVFEEDVAADDGWCCCCCWGK
jgi:hypothetical protein